MGGSIGGGKWRVSIVIIQHAIHCIFYNTIAIVCTMYMYIQVISARLQVWNVLMGLMANDVR